MSKLRRAVISWTEAETVVPRTHSAPRVVTPAPFVSAPQPNSNTSSNVSSTSENVSLTTYRSNIATSTTFTRNQRDWTSPSTLLQFNSARPFRIRVTGSMKYGSRADVESLIRESAQIVASGSSWYNTILIVGKSKGREKIRTANAVRASIYSEEEFYVAAMNFFERSLTAQQLATHSTYLRLRRAFLQNIVNQRVMAIDYIIPALNQSMQWT